MNDDNNQPINPQEPLASPPTPPEASPAPETPTAPEPAPEASLVSEAPTTSEPAFETVSAPEAPTTPTQPAPETSPIQPEPNPSPEPVGAEPVPIPSTQPAGTQPTVQPTQPNAIPATPNPKNPKNSKTGLIIGIIAGVIGILIILIIVFSGVFSGRKALTVEEFESKMSSLGNLKCVSTKNSKESHSSCWTSNYGTVAVYVYTDNIDDLIEATEDIIGTTSASDYIDKKNGYKFVQDFCSDTVCETIVNVGSSILSISSDKATTDKILNTLNYK